MNTRIPAQLLAQEIAGRSSCIVQVGAVIEDHHGIFAWGWNHAGAGFGCHAERHALRRANRHRLDGATVFVAGRYRHNGHWVQSRPCPICEKALRQAGIRRVKFLDRKQWREILI